MKILLSPHPDDETLFAAFTILREKPLVVVVTYPTLQGNNGDERLLESYKAMKILGAPVCFLGIKEDALTEENLREKLQVFTHTEIDVAYIPEYEEGGNPHHNLVNKIGREMFGNTKNYKTYTDLNDRTIGREIIPTSEELELKKLAMNCYVTQKQNANTAHYFNTTKEYE
jgi:LmbE family N-acetylglucosaminyl deacetylase